LPCERARPHNTPCRAYNVKDRGVQNCLGKRKQIAEFFDVFNGYDEQGKICEKIEKIGVSAKITPVDGVCGQRGSTLKIPK
jgi:hypothetical protein